MENALLALKWGKRAKNSLKEFYCERYQIKKKKNAAVTRGDAEQMIFSSGEILKTYSIRNVKKN